MDLKSALLNNPGPELVPGTCHYVCARKSHFNKLMKYFFSGDFHLAHRATLYILEVFKHKPGWVKQQVPFLVNTLDEALPDWYRRNILRILQYQKIPEAQWGHAADQCFNYLSSSEQPVAIKVFSMTVLYNLTRDLPDLSRDLRLHIEEQFPLGSAGFKARGRRILEQLEKEGL
jgi:hypothetical protein